MIDKASGDAKASDLWSSGTYRAIPLSVGGRLAYRDLGTGEPLILIHGWPQHSLMWHTVGPRLARTYRVIAPDLRGTGGSTIKGPYDKASLAGDVLALMDALGLPQVRLAGYDLGAGVAYDLAARHPDRIQALAFMEFGLPGFGYEHEMAARPDWHPGSNWHLSFFTVPDVAEWALAGKERGLLSWFFNHIAMDPGAVSLAHFDTYVGLLERPGALRAGIEYYASVWADTASNTALAQQRLTLPVLGIGGEASAAGWVADGLKAVADDVTSLIVPGAGHWLGDENPVFLADALLAFFASSPS